MFCLTSTTGYHDTAPNYLELEQCIALMACKNTDALRTIYRETNSAVYGFALSILKNEHDAQDVLQETYIKMYAASSSYHPRGKPMAWILTIAKNLARMKLRERNKTSYESFEDQEQFFYEPPNLSLEDKMVLNTALKELSSQECQIVLLHAVSGLKHREISDLLDLALPTVLSKYHRALKKLKNKLSEGYK
ncbi:RNA polymerase sigma factor [Oscillospiraceae bacterium LTW-04]|nr:RNA polymerase sigma factor [Oscillospiraceae bacterium MB24-C1]